MVFSLGLRANSSNDKYPEREPGWKRNLRTGPEVLGRENACEQGAKLRDRTDAAVTDYGVFFNYGGS